jgi:tetratricopeptide (TPR) repeat protein
MRSANPAEALAGAQRAVAGARACLPQHGFLASVLLKLGRVEEADEVVRHAMELGGGAADAYDALAWVSMELGRHERANALYRHAAEVSPREPRFWYNLGCSERSLGRLAQAEAACDQAVALDATQYPSWLLRSELRVQTPQENHVAELQAHLQRAAADDLGRFDEAFHWFATAARTRRERLAYEVAVDERKLARIAEVYRHELCLAAPPTPGGPAGAVRSTRYIFIVGLPRSGTTLVERILTGLPGVRSNGETANFSRALLDAARGDGDVFARAAAADPVAVGAGYARLAEPGAPAERIVEKLPLNYLYLGAIARALPEARILLVSRSPLDSCFAMYRTLFAAGYPFSYDLAELGRYYAAYQQLMNYWRGALGGRVHEIVYEDLVSEPRRIGETIASYCGLPWRDAALDIQNNRSASLTASAAQVRRPIYGSSSGRWRHYRAHLQVLIDTLRAHAISIPA